LARVAGSEHFSGLMPESDSQSGKPIGARLRAALTDEQLSTLLDVAGGAGVLRSLDGALRSADRANGVFAPQQSLEGHENVRVPGVLRGVTPSRS